MADDARSEYDAVGALLAATAGASPSQMFGSPCLKIGGKAFAAFHPDAMTFKLRAPQHGEALALPGAHLFDPSGDGRHVMKEWVLVPYAHAARWPEFGRAAWAYVAAAAGKKV